MQKNSIRFITTTAILIALSVVFQQLRLVIPKIPLGPFDLSTLVIGTLINLTLFISAYKAGLWSGLAVAIITPVIAFFQGHIPIAPMIFAVAFGNSVLVVSVYLLRKLPVPASSLIAAVLKFVLLWVAVAKVIVPIFVAAPKMATALSAAFSWPQLITAVLGAIFAMILVPRLKFLDREEK